MNKNFTIHMGEIKIRKTWSHEVNPCQKTFKSKRDYNRHDKSWKKDD